MKLFDPSLENLINIAEDSIYAGNYQLATDLLTSGLMDEPAYAKLHYTMGWMNHYYVDNKRKAISNYEWTIHFEPEYINAYRNLVEIYEADKKLDPLRSLMRKAENTRNLDKDFIYSVLGKVSEMEGDFKNAIVYYKKALAACVDNEDADELKKHIKRAKVKRMKKNWEKWQLRS